MDWLQEGTSTWASNEKTPIKAIHCSHTYTIIWPRVKTTYDLVHKNCQRTMAGINILFSATGIRTELLFILVINASSDQLKKRICFKIGKKVRDLKQTPIRFGAELENLVCAAWEMMRREARDCVWRKDGTKKCRIHNSVEAQQIFEWNRKTADSKF